MKNFKVQSSIEEIVGSIITIFVVAMIIYVFYTIPTPFQSYFKNSINELLVGFAIIGVIGLVLLILKLLDII